MENNDLIQRFLFENLAIRGQIVKLDESYQTIIQQHAYPPFIQGLLGQGLVLATMLASILKFKGLLSFQFRGQKALTLLVAQCDHNFHIRGLAEWQDTLQQKDVIENLRSGTLVITLMADNAVQPYQGIVEWQGSSLPESIEAYFAQSEQLPTRIILQAGKDQIAGILLQAMPDIGLMDDDKEDEWRRITFQAETVTLTELLELSSADLLHRLFPEDDIRLYASETVSFRCTCSAVRSDNAIILLGEKEAQEEIAEHQMISVTCEFCNSQFSYGRDDVQALFANLKQG
jgi:molecular chaperone Hsp33